MASTPSHTPLSELTNTSLSYRKHSASPFNSLISTRHVKMDFSLFAGGVQHTPSSEQSHAIMDLFPTSFKVSLTSVFLIVVCKKLPAQPWPITVAGLPLYLTTDPDAEPMDCGLTGRGPKLSVDSSISRWHTPSMQAFQKMYGLFDSLNANINRIQWIGSSFLALAAEPPYPDWRSRLPFLINNIRVGYVFGAQAIHEKALRRKVPAGREVDNEAYDVLRPGLMIASRASGDKDNYDVMTTSGICLQSPSGKKYVTVAKHGFPGGVGDQVLHPNHHGQVIAEVSKVFGETDIAIAELANVHYAKETFSESRHTTRLSVRFGTSSTLLSSALGTQSSWTRPTMGIAKGLR